LHGRDLSSAVRDMQAAIAKEVKLPPGFSLSWSGQFEYLERATAKLKIVVPATLLIIFVLLYLTFRRFDEALLIMATLPFPVAVIIAGLLPIMWGSGTGSEVMRRIAAPMVGGMVTAPLLSMFVLPAVYLLMRRRKLAAAGGATAEWKPEPRLRGSSD